MVFKITKHIILWITLLLILNFSDWTWQGFSTENDTFLIPSLYGTAFNILVFYGNAFYFHPHYWRQDKGKYALIISLFLIIISLFEGFLDLQYSLYSGAFEGFQTSLDINHDAGPSLYKWLAFASFSFVCLVVHLLFLALSFGYLMPKENMRNIKLQNEQLKSELKFLKAQIDPHTLFNGINGIYHLIDEDTELAKEYLHGFANILRYQIYDCQEEKIPINKEIHFLERFMRLSGLRVKDDATINLDYPKYEDTLEIAPQIFLPFIENAFKHLSAYDDPSRNRIKSSISIENSTIHFLIQNTFEKGENSTEHQGVGIKNSVNRMALIYPGAHTVDFNKENGVFEVDIKIHVNGKG